MDTLCSDPIAAIAASGAPASNLRKDLLVGGFSGKRVKREDDVLLPRGGFPLHVMCLMVIFQGNKRSQKLLDL